MVGNRLTRVACSLTIVYSGSKFGPLAADMVHPDCGLFDDVLAGAQFC